MVRRPRRSGGRFANLDFCLQIDFLAERYGRSPAERLGVDLEREPELAAVVDWTVFSRASEWRAEQEEKIRIEHGGQPRARTPREIQEERVRQMNAFEELDRKTRGPDAG